MANFGFNALNTRLNSQLTGEGDKKSSLNSARVISIVLDESHPRFKELGEWSALGAIEYDLVDSPKYDAQLYPVAYPLSPNIKNCPLINEVVNIQSAFSNALNLYEADVTITAGKSRKYYTTVVNIWNHPHHNAYSFKINSTTPTQNKTYDQIQAGSTSIPVDTPIPIKLGSTFVERSNIHPLRPFEGDIIYEGRWGNSIRFGSTVKNGFNTWSNFGSNGDPITIIRNDQGKQVDEGWTPITEDINNIKSSIYLTSTQNIPLNVKSADYASYSKEKIPTAPNKFAGAQIILSSGRLVFNSSEDHILFSSAKSINLNSIESVNIDTVKFITRANNIFLGKEDLAKEPLLYGNATVKALKDLYEAVKTLNDTLNTLTSDPIVAGESATFNKSLLIPTTQVDVILKGLSKALGTSFEDCTLTSKTNFTA